MASKDIIQPNQEEEYIVHRSSLDQAKLTFGSLYRRSLSGIPMGEEPIPGTNEDRIFRAGELAGFNKALCQLGFEKIANRVCYDTLGEVIDEAISRARRIQPKGPISRDSIIFGRDQNISIG